MERYVGENAIDEGSVRGGPSADNEVVFEDGALVGIDDLVGVDVETRERRTRQRRCWQ